MTMIARALFFLVAIAAGACARAREEVVIANGEWPPYQSRTLPDYGLASKIVTEAFAQRGVAVRYVFIPWQRAVREAREGRIDGLMVWSDNPDEHADFRFSDPIFDSRPTIFFRRGKERRWSQPSELAPLTLGAVRGYDYCQDFVKAERDHLIRVDRAATEEAAFSMLAANRVDAVIADQRVARYLMSTLPDPAAIVADRSPICSNPLGLVLSNRAPDGAGLMDRFNAGLAELRRSGRLDQILDR